MSVEINDTAHADTAASSRRDDLIDAERIAAETGVNVKTARAWMSSGELRSMRLGRRFMTRRAWFEQFLDDRASS